MLRDLQKERITQLLKTDDQIPWKVLILDKKTHEIILPIIKLNELRAHNVTTYFIINKNRSKIKNTPAVYFIDDSYENIEYIISDIKKKLYLSYHLNFLDSISRTNLEKMADSAAELGVAYSVKSIFDQYLNFIAIQNDMFTFNHLNSYVSPMTDKDVANMLFGIFVTIKEPPFIVYDPSTESIAKHLCNKIKGTPLLKDTRKKPLLILLDRDFDIKSPLEHVWSYGALVMDLINLKSNRVTLKKDKGVFDLDPEDDFWAKNSEEYFPLVAEKIEGEMVGYQKEMASRSLDDKSDKNKIAEALEKAPELLKKKNIINAHMSICLELVEEIKKRNIDDFYKIERNGFKKQELLDIADKGTDEDILRLCISVANNENRHIVEALLKDRKINPKILSLFKDDEPVIGGGISYKNAVSNILGSVKKLLPVSTDSKMSKHVEKVVKMIRNQDLGKLNMYNPFGVGCFEKEISCIVVFCNRGGFYNELKSLNELGKRLGHEIIYGSTEIINSTNFLSQLREKHNY